MKNGLPSNKSELERLLRKIAESEAAKKELRKSKKAQRESEMTYRALFEQSNDAVFLFNKEGYPLSINNRAAEMLGYSKDELLRRHFFMMITASQRKDAQAKFEAILAGRPIPAYERIFRKKDDTEFPVEIDISLVRAPDGRPLFIQSIVRDITERKTAEENIKTALKEKEVLLREIHHRVKNNMQVIISLLRLQSRTLDDPKSREVFKTMQDRIRSMALVYEKLYYSADLAHIDFGGYIHNLVAHLFNSAGFDTSRIRLELETQDVELDINKAVPCGLIINELVTNALKHAFPGDREGRIHIVMSSPGKGRNILFVSDDGVGLPAAVDIQNPETLGLQIIKDLAEQIDATLEIERSNGTSFKLEF